MTQCARTRRAATRERTGTRASKAARNLATAALAGVLLAGCGGAAAERVAGEPFHLQLPVAEVVEPHPPYAAFCRRQPAQCDLRGPATAIDSPRLLDLAAAINRAVNREIRFLIDNQQYDCEEYWALPASGRGDCEDLALEKRARLVRAGVPRGALRIALVLHRELLSSHAVLTLETTGGTYVLDSFTDAVLPWDRTPFNFEARERPDGRWDRYDQNHWR